jgi:hypothetical protein
LMKYSSMIIRLNTNGSVIVFKSHDHHSIPVQLERVVALDLSQRPRTAQAVAAG